MTNTSRVVFTEPNTVVIATEPLPEVPGSGEVRVRATRSLISTGTETIALSGKFAAGSHWADWVKYPFYPGYSTSGEITAVGEGVPAELVGRRVCTRTAHASLVDVPLRSVTFIPDGVSDEEATWFGLANIVQFGVRRAQHRMGDAVVIVGMGILGQLAFQYVKNLSPRKVICLDMAEQRLKLAHQGGADTTVQKPVGAAASDIDEILQGEPMDVIYDVTGHAPVFSDVLQVAGRGTRVLLLSDAGYPAPDLQLGHILRKGLTVIGAHDALPPTEATPADRWTHPAMTAHFFDQVARGQMDVAHLITHRFPAAEAPDAYGLLMRDRDSAMGVILEWEQLSA